MQRRALTDHLIKTKRDLYRSLYELQEDKRKLDAHYPETDDQSAALELEKIGLDVRIEQTTATVSRAELYGRKLSAGLINECPVCFINDGKTETLLAQAQSAPNAHKLCCQTCGFAISFDD